MICRCPVPSLARVAPWSISPTSRPPSWLSYRWQHDHDNHRHHHRHHHHHHHHKGSIINNLSIDWHHHVQHIDSCQPTSFSLSSPSSLSTSSWSSWSWSETIRSHSTGWRQRTLHRGQVCRIIATGARGPNKDILAPRSKVDQIIIKYSHFLISAIGDTACCPSHRDGQGWELRKFTF